MIFLDKILHFIIISILFIGVVGMKCTACCSGASPDQCLKLSSSGFMLSM